jgi:L-ascorbate metabolism protein UlaG (beta-lactamase superfamily)
MSSLKGIDVVFLPMNQPYTMAADQFLEAVRLFKPSIVYPYHFGDTNLDPIREGMKAIPETRLVIRPMN